MADSPSDFIDFNAWKDITSASEAEALQRQQNDVATKADEAQRLLRKAANDAGAMQSQQRSMGGPATAGLSSVGSYGDYLKAKQAAVNARAMMALGGVGAYGDTRRAVDAQQGYSQGAQGVLDDLQGREDRRGQWVQEDLVSGNKSAEAQREWQRRKDAADAERARLSREATDKFNNVLRAKMRAAWAEQDQRHKNSGGFGGLNPFKDGTQGFGGEFNPFGFRRAGFGEGGAPNPDEAAMMGRNAYFGLEDNQRLAQMARSQGLGGEADRFQSGATYDFWGNRTKGGY